MKSTKTTLKDDDVDYDSLSPFNKTLFPHTLHLLLPVALLPIAIVLLCLYFYPLPLTQSQPQPHQLHHVTLSPQGTCMFNFISFKLFVNKFPKNQWMIKS